MDGSWWDEEQDFEVDGDAAFLELVLDELRSFTGHFFQDFVEGEVNGAGGCLLVALL